MGTSIVILSYNNLNYTKQCYDSIKTYTNNEDYEIIIIDNNSSEETKEWLKSLKDIKLQLNSVNRGFPGGCNDGIKLSKEDNDILLLNNDIVVTENWLTNLRRALYSSQEIGIVDPVTNSSSYWQSISVPYKTIEEMQEFAANYNSYSSPDYWEQRVKLIGYCLLIKRDVINKIGLLDEIYFPGNYEDDDLCIRSTLAGFKHLLCRDTFVHHYGSSSFSSNSSFGRILYENAIKFRNKWGFFSASSLAFNTSYLEIIPPTENLKVLDIYGDGGVNGCMLKFHRRNLDYYICESSRADYKIASKLHSVYSNSDCNTKFDYVIINDFDSFIYDDLIKETAYKSFENTKNIIFFFNSKLYVKADDYHVISLNNFINHIIKDLNFNHHSTLPHGSQIIFLFSK